MSVGLIRAVLAVWAGLSTSGPAIGQSLFVDVTDSSGVSHTGESYGASWGDFDGDGWPDLWVGNHVDDPSLFRNNRNGTFSSIASSVWPGNGGDTHGAAWGDFDNDGDQDLIEVVGGAAPNHLFVNEGGAFVEAAQAHGMASPGARSRTPLWFDWNRDGLLDLILTHELGDGAYPLLMVNSGGLFTDANIPTGVGEINTLSAYLADLTDDGILDIVFSNGNGNRGPFFSPEAIPFVNLIGSTQMPVVPSRAGCADTAIADFNGDLKNDIFATCGGGGREVVQRTDTKLEVRITAVAEETAVEFASPGAIAVSVYPSFDFIPSQHLRAGGNGVVPPYISHPELGYRSFTTSLQPESVIGTPPHVPGGVLGLYISRDSISGRWRLALSTPTAAALSIVVNSVAAISDVSTIGFSATPTPSKPTLLLRTSDGFVDAASQSGLGVGMPCPSVVAGDFDNDMDVDLYLECSRTINNLPNLLFLNDGTGKFTGIVNAGGAPGSDLASGDTVTTADYDNDGFLDLFVTNGAGGAPFSMGPNQLYRNVGNGNAWLELDLVGSTSNRDAVGAVVKVTAGGRAQIRTLDNGMHRYAQNAKRLHFGLGSSSEVDSIEIRWPSGAVQVIPGSPVRQILTLYEAGNPDMDGDGVSDVADNCIRVPNPSQCDSDGDGFGNHCDGDLGVPGPGNGVTNTQDYALFRAQLGQPSVAPTYNKADLNCNGAVNTQDFAIFRGLLGTIPGPSGLHP